VQEKQKELLESRLKKIEGQVRGIQRMIKEDRYCVDILTQTASIVSALKRVEDEVMENHLQTCVSDAIKEGTAEEKDEKISEVMTLLKRFRKHG
jgi:DNA-binding FrmR family transcriptional regulator